MASCTVKKLWSDKLECLESTLGLRNICEEDDVILYLDDLPMMDIETFAATARPSDVSGKNFFKRMRRLAAQQVSRDFLSSFSSQVQFNEVLSVDVNGGYDHEEREFLPMADQFVGRKMWRNNDDPYMSMRVNWIEFDSNTELVKYLYLWDGYELVKAKIDVKKGINRISIGFTGDFLSIFLQRCNIEIGKPDNNCSCSSGSCNECYAIRNIYLDGLDENGTFTEGGDAPFKVSVSCVCAPDEFTCMYKDQLTHSLRWKTAALVFDEVRSSNKVNPLVRNSKDEAEFNYNRIMGGVNPTTGFDIKINEAHYWAELFSIQKQFKKSIKPSRCTTCRGTSYTERR